jgi:hypothetical protein
MGKRLNAQVIKLDGEFAKVLGQIEQLKSQVEARLVAWLERFERWRSYSSARSAFRVALCTYVIVLAALLMVQPESVRNFSATVSQHIWFPTAILSSTYGAIVVASGASATIGALTWIARFRQLYSEFPGGDDFDPTWVEDEVETLDSFVNSYWENEGEGEGEPEFSDDDTEWDEQPKKLSCYEILGVGSNASAAEIRTAYREKIKQYHPDRVAALGPKLKAVAERETKMLNVAYEETLRRAGVSPSGAE